MFAPEEYFQGVRLLFILTINYDTIYKFKCNGIVKTEKTKERPRIGSQVVAVIVTRGSPGTYLLQSICVEKLPQIERRH